jgi:hypothetical protein
MLENPEFISQGIGGNAAASHDAGEEPARKEACT